MCKAALTLKGAGGEKLLDSYHAERYPIIEKLLPMIEQSEEMIIVNSPLLAKLRDHLLSIVTDFGFVQSLGSRALGGFLVNYRGSKIIGEHTLSPIEHLRRLGEGFWHPNPLDDIDFARAPQSGDRAPDATKLNFGEQKDVRLFELWKRDVKHQLLVFAGENRWSDERRSEIEQTLEQMRRKYGDFVAGYLIETENSNAENSQNLIFDAKNEMHERYGARRECLYLVRPDGYVGFRSQPADFAALADYLNAAFDFRAKE